MFSTLDEKIADPYRDRGTTRNGAVSFLTYETRFYQIVQNVATPLASPLAHGPYFSTLTSICHSLGNASYVGDAILYYSCTIGAAMSLTLLILASML